MNNRPLLYTWLILSFLSELIVLGGVGYLVVWKSAPDWLFILAFIWGFQPSLYKVLRKEFGVKEESE